MCDGVRQQTINASPRTQSSIAVSSDRTDWVLFNASPDILTQIQQCGVLQPARQLRDTGICSIVLMDAQIDHTTGLLMLREHQQPLSIWCTAPVREDLSEGNPLFKVLQHYCDIDWHEIELNETQQAIPGAHNIQFLAQPLISNAPPYSPHRDQPVRGDTIGMFMRNTNNNESVFYAPGLGEMEPHVWATMQKASVVLVDGTMWTDNEMIERGASTKTARSMGHLPQSGPGGMIEWLEQLPPTTRKILIHINNTNPILNQDSPERMYLTQRGIEVADDGMEIEL